MKKGAIFSGFLLIFFVISATNGGTQLRPDAIDAVKPHISDLPDGFTYGKVPTVYKKTLKDNPWMMDKAAIRRLADKIYPGGDFNRIMNMHMSIMAKKDRPFGDDIVCYVILYRDAKSAREEIKKASEFTGNNSDRCILLIKENLAVLLFVDDVNNFHFIRDMAVILEERMKQL